MDRAALLADFRAKVDEFAKFQGFIEKTRAQASKFAATVVEKVLKTNIEKRDEIVAELIPLMADVDGVILELNEQKAAIEAGREGSKMQMQELELRVAIDELTQEQFEAQSKELRDLLGRGDSRIGEIDTELGHFRAALGHWREIGEEAGVLSAAAPAAPDEGSLVEFEEPAADDEPEADEEEEEEEDDEEEEEPEDEDDAFEEGEEISVDDDEVETFQAARGDDGVRFEPVRQAEDVSVVFADEEDSEGIKLEVGDMDTLVDDDLQAVEEQGEERPRRAVMLYQEGTAEEQVYPFNGDLMTLGRGRDNDIQVKNDSKVSRYHCKLYRRNGNFYIEDNKSANGTLVNGELVTERRLFGGEEIIIGETFFRFRIMD